MIGDKKRWWIRSAVILKHESERHWERERERERGVWLSAGLCLLHTLFFKQKHCCDVCERSTAERIKHDVSSLMCRIVRTETTSPHTQFSEHPQNNSSSKLNICWLFSEFTRFEGDADQTEVVLIVFVLKSQKSPTNCDRIQVRTPSAVMAEGTAAVDKYTWFYYDTSRRCSTTVYDRRTSESVGQ